MTKVMMLLGFYPFMLDTAAYQQLKRTSTYRWKQQDRIGRKPAQQYVGPGADQITLSGEILPHWKGGYQQLDMMRLQASRGKPLILLEGYGGFVLGDWVILRIDETKSELMADGSPRVIKFSMTLKEYGGDHGGFDALQQGIAAVNTLARLL
ncbi:phage tail protein [Thalassobius sp. I31.1]|uniref:phage tail protein n=1 Tax=Thalassobius sp. I31.1 TaxID=2109912 RepID=UPI000D199B0E|nr:phage tail protein [Thalassobius sp. I31.1]